VTSRLAYTTLFRSPYMANWSYPEFGQLKADDGQTLHYQVYKPNPLADNQRYPAIVMVYGGPRAQRVTNSWGDYFTQYLVQQGYVVFKLDNRGSGNRGRQFENPIYRQMASVEVADQILYYQVYKPNPLADNQRYPAIVMVYGGPRAQRVTNSWGDYFTQYLVQQGYVVFKLDNRGSGNRGRQFENPIYRQMASVEVAD